MKTSKRHQVHSRSRMGWFFSGVLGWAPACFSGVLPVGAQGIAMPPSPSSPEVPTTQVSALGPSAAEAASQSADDLLIAAPENFNPGLFRPPVAPPPVPAPAQELTPQPFTPGWQPTDLIVDFDGDFTNLGQDNSTLESTVNGILANGDRLAFTSGINFFSQPGTDSVLNIPLRTAWTREMGDFTTTLGGGLEIFDQRPWDITLEARTSVPLGDQATLFFEIDRGPYKFNAQTLNNQITAWRFGPNLYWQIDPQTSFFSLVRWGHYSDGNREQQSFSRLERRLGDFSIAANLFNWRYRRDAEATSGYFSPLDFLVANAEVAWQGSVLSWLDCKASANLGQQRLSGRWSPASSYEALCTALISETVELDLGYGFSSVSSQGSDSSATRIQGQVRAQF